MPDQLMQFKASPPLKLVMTLTVLLALFASWFVVRWYLGNTIAEYFHPEDHRLEIAHMAVGLAPSDPLPHWRLGNLAQTELPPDQITLVITEYEKAVSLSPNDYRLWMDFGSALEQAGDFDKAEKALREAVKLAPSYAYPRWLLGNLLLRTDRYPEGFAELQRASEANAEFQSQLFNLAGQLYKNDFDSLKNSVGDLPEMRAAFSKYLIERGRFDEGLRLWNSLTELDKRESRPAADSIIGSLVGNQRYHQAMEIWNEVAPGPAYHAELGHILDEGFEDNLAHGPGAVFGWQVQSNPQVQIGIDAGQGHTGSRSLRVYFQVRTHIDTINVSQLVPVKPLPLLFIASAVGAAMLLPVSLAFGEQVIPRDWTWVLLLAIGSQVIGQGLLVYAIGALSPLVVGLALLTQPAISALVGWFAYCANRQQ